MGETLLNILIIPPALTKFVPLLPFQCVSLWCLSSFDAGGDAARCEDRITFLPTAESTRELDACFYYNASMETPPTDRRAVEAAVASLQERLADGDPADAALRSHCEAVLLALRAAYRVNPSDFSRETIEALRELSELLRESTPNAGGTENPQ